MIKFQSGQTYKLYRFGKFVGTIKCIATPKEGKAKFEGNRCTKLYSSTSGIVEGRWQEACESYYTDNDLQAYAAAVAP